MSKRVTFLGIILLLLAFRNKNVVLLLQFLILLEVFFKAKINSQAIKYAVILALPIFIAGSYGLYRFPVYDVLKDCFYFLNPVLFLILGFRLGRVVGNEKTFVIWCILFGTLLSCVHIVTVIFIDGFDSILDPRVLRDEYDIRNYVLSVAALFLLTVYTFIWKQRFLGQFFWVFFFLNLFSLYLSGSRSDILLFLCALLSAFTLISRYRLLIILFIAMAVLSSWYSIQMLPESNKTVEVLKRSLSELSFTAATDAEERNSYYRGWESYRTWITYRSGTTWEQLAGHGMGAMADLGVKMILGGEDAEPRQFIPFMHNGYMYLLLKTGLIGILLFGIFFYSVFRQALRIRKREIIMVASFLFAILVTNVLIATIFNFAYVTFWLLVGAFLCYADIPKVIRKKQYDQNVA
ncbi:MAG: O-antigen ligase family protein [Victivallales bacterium]|jgi:hypothetical protein